MAVIKGNAYGHGAEPCVQAMNGLCDWYGVATMQGVSCMRNVSGEKPILVFDYVSDEGICLATGNSTALSAFSAMFPSHISERCVGIDPKITVHLELDTGFHHMGIDCCSSTADCVEQLLSLFSLLSIEMTGIYTHLVYGIGSDQGELAFTGLQYQRFQSCIRALQKQGIDTGICHICNSRAAIHVLDMHMDMARIGVYIFGLVSTPEQRLMSLREVLIWKTRIALLRDIAVREGVGYGHTFVIEQPIRIAVLVIGFTDGYRRCIAQSPQSYVSIHGGPTPLIGKVCMDMFMVNVADIEAVWVGEYMLLSGGDGTGAVSSYLLGQIIQGTAGEIAMGMSGRVQRCTV